MVGEHYLRYYATIGPGFHGVALRQRLRTAPGSQRRSGRHRDLRREVLVAHGVRIDWDGEQTRDYVYVADVARANILALDAADDEAINIGGGVGTSVNALHATIAAAAGRDVEVEHAPKRAGDIRTCVFAIEKARTVLGWQPSVGMTAGIAKTVDFFKGRAPKR